MNLENTKTLEIALINLAFARSELALITNPSDVVRRAIEHIESAVTDLSKLAPNLVVPQFEI